MRRFLALATLTTLLALPLGGVAYADAEVTINDDGVSPETVKADIREMIIWTNASDADVSLVGTDPKWESGPIEPGATFSIEITKAGTYAYESSDGSISGEIEVAGGEAADDDGAKADDKDSKDGKKGAVEGKGDEIDPDAEALPMTGIDATLPGALSLALIVFGAGLLTVTHPPRRSRA